MKTPQSAANEEERVRQVVQMISEQPFGGRLLTAGGAFWSRARRNGLS
jgi:hypothetical protein